jgi:hypothetical protein
MARSSASIVEGTPGVLPQHLVMSLSGYSHLFCQSSIGPTFDSLMTETTHFRDSMTPVLASDCSLGSMRLSESIRVRSLHFGETTSPSTSNIKAKSSKAAVSGPEEAQQSGRTLLQAGALIGLAVGGLALLVCIVSIGFLISRRSRSVSQGTTEDEPEMGIQTEAFRDTIGSIVFENQMDSEGGCNRSEASHFESREEGEGIMAAH